MTSPQDQLFGPCEPTHRLVVDLSNKSAHVLDADDVTVCHVGPGVTRRTVAEMLAPHGWAPVPGASWESTSPPDGFWTWAMPIPPMAAPFQPVHGCRELPTRHCPTSYGEPCGDDRPCARLDSDDPTPWLQEIRSSQ